MNAPSSLPPAAPPTRRAEVLEFVQRYWLEHAHSPSNDEISKAIGISETRVRQLLHQLQVERSITITRGPKRAIGIVGLAQQLIVAQLRAEGWTVDEDVRRLSPPGGCGNSQLPLVAILDHLPPIDDDRGVRHGQASIGSRAPTRRAPRARTAAAESDEGKAA